MCDRHISPELVGHLVSDYFNMSHLLHNFNQIPVDPGLVAVFPIPLTSEVVYSRYCVIPFIKPQNQGEPTPDVSRGAGG